MFGPRHHQTQTKEEKAMSDKPVAIVVAAGGGIGGACTRELAQRGYDLVLMSAGGSAVKLADELGGTAVTGSVAEAADLKAVVDTALEKHGRIDAVLNNTGHVAKGAGPARGSIYDADDDSHFIEIGDEDWHHALDMIVLNVVRMARLVTPVMESQGGGAILNVSSFAGKEPSAKYPVGAALRMALAGFMKLYSDRYGQAGIRMNNILPGFVDNYEMADDARRQIPLGRPCSSDELAKTAAFLLSADAGYITGQSIVVDGGLTRSM
jgi:NAD(P)-dependent dehydrogenase (short-subunit alcohol dehydrogenase family)